MAATHSVPLQRPLHRLPVQAAPRQAADVNHDTLTIVVPALNEEEAIAATITRCLEARDRIMKATGLSSVEIIVVSDGSTDKTAAIAQSFAEVSVIVFDENRGYGAAIKEGWRRGHGALLGFLDADGTCDPTYFAEMCQIVREDGAAVVLGSRLGPASRMPWVRRLGNRLYAVALGFLCGRQVTDIASGMRVVRRSALKYLYPLPSGLQFTPSMSARALMNNLRLIEIPMSYQERIGTSKLHVFYDGIRFLQTIFTSVLCFRPERVLLLTFSACLVAMGLLTARPTEFYVEHGQLEEWMLYRFVVCYLLGTLAQLLLLATALTHHMARFSRRRPEALTFWPAAVEQLFRGPALAVMLVLFVVISLLFLWPGIVEYGQTGRITLHWSRLLAGAFSLFSLFQTAVFALLIQIVSIWERQAGDPERRMLDAGGPSCA